MKVFLNKQLPEIGMRLLADSHIQLITPDKLELSKEEWLHYCKQADAVLNVGKNNFDADFFESCPNVKAIALFSVGYDHVAITEATKRKIPVGNTPDVLSKATSDTAFLLMQSVARRASFNFRRIPDGGWNTAFDPTAHLGQELYGKTLGIYGLGRIGLQLAQTSKNAFGMEIIYHNRSRNEAAEKALNARYVSFEELIAQSDVVSVHANYTENQSELFNATVFSQMKPTAIFINTARGGFHNEEDLYAAITGGQIWGAGLDVTNPEPMDPSSPLLELPTVCIFPHIGSATKEARDGMARIATENIIAFAQGKKMPFVVNDSVYDKS